MPPDTGFMRHVRACNTAALPGGRLPFQLAGVTVGWLGPEMAAALDTFPDVQSSPHAINLTDPPALPAISRALSERGLYRFRHEAFDVRASAGGDTLSQIDRGAIPSFGIEATGVHVNGLTRRDGGLSVWIARRAANKLLDPGKLDHVVAGGVPAGLGLMETVIKEAGEEATIPPALAATARHVGEIRYAMVRPEGLRRDHLHCYDIDLPGSFVPEAADGEVESFELWPIARAFETVRDTDAFKFNVNLVLIDLFIRLGLIAGEEASALRVALRPA